MVMGLRRIQIGQESTRGTAVAADVILLGRLTATPTPNWYKPDDEERNSLALNHRLTNVGQQSSLSYEGSLTFEQVGHLLSMGVGALTTSQPDVGGSPLVYDHTFEPTLSALAVQKAYTVEYGDNQQEYESAFLMAAALEFSYAIGEPWQVSADLFARFPSKSTFTGALSAPAVEDVVGQKTKIYIDSSWANLGTTQVSSTLINAKVGGNTGLVPTRYSDGSLEFSDVAENKWASQVELTFKHNASGIVQYDNMAAGTLVFVRLEAEGSTIQNAFNNTWRIDLAMRYTEAPEQFGEQDGEDVIALVGETFHDPTADRQIRYLVRNNVASF